MVAILPRATVPVPWCIEVSFPSPGTARLTVTGDIDLATAPKLGMQPLIVMTEHSPAVIDVDLAAVTFLDCSGIGVLVAVRNAAEQTGCEVWISHPQPMPRDGPGCGRVARRVHRAAAALRTGSRVARLGDGAADADQIRPYGAGDGRQESRRVSAQAPLVDVSTGGLCASPVLLAVSALRG